MTHAKNEESTVMFPPIGTVYHTSDFTFDESEPELKGWGVEKYSYWSPVDRNLRTVEINVFDILNVNGFSKLSPLDIEYWGSDAGIGEAKMLANLYGFKKESGTTISERIPAEFDSDGYFTGFTVSGYEYVMLVPKSNWRTAAQTATTRLRPLSEWIQCETE
jgi:hypothetical protein